MIPDMKTHALSLKLLAVALLATITSHARAAENESNLVLLDTENPAIRALAAEAGDEATYISLNDRNKIGVFFSEGVWQQRELKGSKYLEHYGFTLLNPWEGKAGWNLDDFSKASATSMFFMNGARYQPLPNMSWQIAGNRLEWQQWSDQASQTGVFTSQLNDKSGSWDSPSSAMQLYKRFEFPSGLNYSVQGETGYQKDRKEISNTAGKLVIVVHGWNREPDADPFDDVNWTPLLKNLNAQIESKRPFVSGWDLYAYHWGNDSYTGNLDGNGGTTDAVVINPQNAHDSNGVGLGVENGSQAAEIGYQHGLVLGKLIRDHCVANGIALEKVHFIAHSAGTWVARSASLYLDKTREGSSLNQQITLLDPYNPSNGYDGWTGEPSGDYPDNVDPSQLGTTQINNWVSSGMAVARSENIYSMDTLTFGTNEVYASFQANRQIGESTYGMGYYNKLSDASALMHWGGHSGPINFFAYTVDPQLFVLTVKPGSRDNSSTFMESWNPGTAGHVNVVGWEHSLFMQEFYLAKPKDLSKGGFNFIADVIGAQQMPSFGTRSLAPMAMAAAAPASPWKQILVDVDSVGWVRAMLLPVAGGTPDLAGPVRPEPDGTFSITLENGSVLTGGFDTTVTPAALTLAIDGVPFGQRTPGAQGNNGFAGVDAQVLPDGKVVVSLVLPDGTAGMVARRDDENTGWEGAGNGAVDGQGNVNVSGEDGFQASGQFGGDGGLVVESVAIVPPQVPEIHVTAAADGAILLSGTASKVFGETITGTASPAYAVTIRNTGTVPLTGIGLSFAGDHPDDFTATGLAGSTLLPDAAATINVTFRPQATGTRTAILHIASNDRDENPFDINLSGTGLSLPALPEVTLGLSAASVVESNANYFAFSVNRTTTQGALTVNFTLGGTATRIEDYTLYDHATLSGSTGTVVIPDGSSSVTFYAQIYGDTWFETDESIVVTLAAGNGYSLGNPSQRTGIIENDDAAAVPEVTLGLSQANVNEDSGGTLACVFTRTGNTGALAVEFTIDGTATLDTDYSVSGAAMYGSSGIVTIPDGQESATVIVTPQGDAIVEGNETVKIIAYEYSGGGYTLGSPSAQEGTITDDETGDLSDALDTSDLSWTTGGEAPWFRQTAETHDGEDAAQSGDISKTGKSWLETTVEGPGVLSFRWWVSSTHGNDGLQLFLNGEEVSLVRQGIPPQIFQDQCMALGEGEHTIRWVVRSMPDEPYDQWKRTARIDHVEFTPQGIVGGVLAPAAFGLPYTHAMKVIGAAAPYVWSITPGYRLPRGLVMGSDGVVRGKPTSYWDEFGPFEVRVTDGYGRQFSRLCQVVVRGAPTLKVVAAPLVRGNPWLDLSGEARLLEYGRIQIRVESSTDNGLSWQEASGNWSSASIFPLPWQWQTRCQLKPGRNRILMRAVDGYLGTTSAVVEKIVNYVLPAPVMKSPIQGMKLTELPPGSAGHSVNCMVDAPAYLKPDGTPSWEPQLELSRDGGKTWESAEDPDGTRAGASYSWQQWVTPGIGPNDFSFRLTDEEGNAGPVVTRRVNYLVNRPLVVTVPNPLEGALSSGFGGTTTRQLGYRYTVTATARTGGTTLAPGKIFQHWLRDGEVVSQDATYSFVMEDSLNLTPVFMDNPYPPLAGNFGGWVSVGMETETQSVADAVNMSARSGIVTLSVLGTGKYTGTLRLGARVLPLRGAFNGYGESLVTIKTKGQPDLRVYLQMDLENGGCTGSVFAGTDDAAFAEINLQRVVTYTGGVGSVFPLAGARYAFALPPNPSAIGLPQPEGAGFGSVVFSANGTATVTGKLADGTGFTTSTRAIVGEQGIMDDYWLVPVHIPLYSAGKGQLLGTLYILKSPGETDPALSGGFSWVRPPDAKATQFRAGFNVTISGCVGARYAYVKGQNILTGEVNESAIRLELLDSWNDYSNGSWPATNVPSLYSWIGAYGSIAFNASSGQFSGKLGARSDESGFTIVTVPYQGTILCDTSVDPVSGRIIHGYGFLLVNGQSRMVRITTTPP